MGKITGFMEFRREDVPQREIFERVHDFKPIYKTPSLKVIKEQSARCMDCGIPFCHFGCPLGNRIPEWIDHAYHDDWKKAQKSLEETNNFPELTGWLCPAPCEDSCVLSLIDKPVTIKEIEKTISKYDTLEPRPPKKLTGKTVGIVGSGPAGLAAAQQLRRAGHEVTVFERDDKPGGLIRYGIPDFKMDKALLDKRLKQLKEEGIQFVLNYTADISICDEFDAVVMAAGALQEKGLKVPGRELKGIHLAMEYLKYPNSWAYDKHVIVIGGGDTGADCVGTAIRQGAKSVLQLQYHTAPPLVRDSFLNPWPETLKTLSQAFVYEEGGIRLFSRHTERFIGEKGHVTALELKEGEILPCDLALIATGFSGTDSSGLLEPRRNAFITGDMERGASLIVWAIADGRRVAHNVDRFLMGNTFLPVP